MKSAVIVMLLAGLVSGCSPTAESPTAESGNGLLPGRLVGTWIGPDGEPASDGDPPRSWEVLVRTGPEHCDWTSVIFMQVAWPPGARTDSHGGRAEERLFIRDVHGALVDKEFQERLELDAELPDDSVATGYSREGIEVWLGPDRGDDAVYMVTGDRVERWPRADPFYCI